MSEYKKQNVLFLIENISRIGGTEKAVISLAKILVSSLRFRVSILSVESSEDNKIYEIPDEIKIIHLNCHERFFRKYGTLKKKISEMSESEKIDYLVSSGHNFSCFLLPYFSKRMKCVACEHINRSMVSFSKRILQRIFYPCLYKVVVLTEKEKLSYKFLNDKVCVIPNSVENKENTKAFVKRNPKNIILSAGRLVPIKGFDILINAVSKIKDSLKNYEVRICGNGFLKDELQRQVEKLGLNEVVKILPAHDLRDEYAAAKIFVLPSREEPFGLVLIEAMRAGVPCVAFSSSGPDFIFENDEEILVKCDEKLLGERIKKLISNNELCEKICRKQNAYLEKFSVEKIGRMWLEQVFC